MRNRTALISISSLLFIASFSCEAVYEPPVNRATSLTVGFDKSSLPTSLIIWDSLSGGRDDTNGQKWGRNTLTCQSSSDTTNGACATRSAWANASTNNRQNVRLSFSLKGSPTKVDLNIEPWHEWSGITGQCAGITKKLLASLAYGCGGELAVSNKFTYSIPQSELAKLSSPGTWTASLKQDLRIWDENGNYGVIAVWNADIAFTVTVLKSQQVYFPKFPYSAPHVNLNLSNRPGTSNNKNASGRSLLDMCLYDGKNSTSSQINITFRDEGAIAPGRPAGFFSVYRNGADKNRTENRIDYQLSVLNPTTGEPQTVNNGTDILWANTNARHIQRQVVIPGVPGVSLCVPAPLTLTTPQFRLADKSAGVYSGVLTVIYTPSTQTKN